MISDKIRAPLAPGIYLVATPIGNLKDITLRALEVLGRADVVAAEDTRNTLKLLNHYEIKAKLISYHAHNRLGRSRELIALAKAGRSVALVSDAGMPVISDPGEELVVMAHEEGVFVTVVPGASASLAALCLSGLPGGRFAFEGFPASDAGGRREQFAGLVRETRTMIFYESPHRLKKTLEDLKEAFGGERRITILRELTKVHEEVRSMTLAAAQALFEGAKEGEKGGGRPRGEYVLVLEGISPEALKREENERWQSLSLCEHVELHTRQGMTEKEAMKQAAKERGMGKREVYQKIKGK